MVKKRTILFIFAWLLIFPMSVQAADVEYTLFDSTIQVNQDRTLDVSENYHLYFIENTNEIKCQVDINQKNSLKKRRGKEYLYLFMIVEGKNRNNVEPFALIMYL